MMRGFDRKAGQKNFRAKGLSKIYKVMRWQNTVTDSIEPISQTDEGRLDCNASGRLPVNFSKSRAQHGTCLMQAETHSYFIGAADENISNLGPLLVLVDADVCEQFSGSREFVLS